VQKLSINFGIVCASNMTSLIWKFLCGCRFACSLLRQGMKQIIISSDTPETKSLEKMEDKSAADAVNDSDPKLLSTDTGCHLACHEMIACSLGCYFLNTTRRCHV